MASMAYLAVRATLLQGFRLAMSFKDLFLTLQLASKSPLVVWTQ